MLTERCVSKATTSAQKTLNRFKQYSPSEHAVAAKKIVKKKRQEFVPDVVKGIREIGDIESHIVSLIYGKAGRGKTEILSTFPTPILLLNIDQEEGLKTIKNKKGIQIVDINTWDEFLDLEEWLRVGRDYETIGLDQITSLQSLGQQMIADKRRKSVEDLFGMWGKAWGELSGEIKTGLQSYRELRRLYNVVFLGHERTFQQDENADESDLAPVVGANTMPSVGSFIEGASDIVMQCFIRSTTVRDEKGKKVRKMQYCGRVGPHPNYITKIRRPVDAGPIPEYIVNPSYQKLVSIEAGEDIRTTKKKRRE